MPGAAAPFQHVMHRGKVHHVITVIDALNPTTHGACNQTIRVPPNDDNGELNLPVGRFSRFQSKKDR